jgi:hypothetical protein
MEIAQAFLAWLAGAGGAYLAVEVRIRWITSTQKQLIARVERLEEKVITGRFRHGSSASP